MKKPLIILVCFLMASVCFSQENETLKELFIKLKKHSNTDTNKVKILNDIAWEYGYFDPEKSLEYCRQSLRLSQQLNYPSGEAEIYNVMGNNMRVLNKFDSAHYYLNRALDIRKRQNDSQKVAAVTINIANIYFQQLKYSDAIIKYNEAIKIAGESNFKKGSLVALTNLSSTYRSAGLQEKALESMKQALEINKVLKDTLQEPYLYSTLATILNEMNDVRAAVSNNKKALEQLKNHPDVFLKISVLNNLGTQMRDMGNYDSSLVILQEAIRLEIQNNDSVGLGATNSGIALLYQAQKQYDFCLAFADKSKTIARAINDTATYANSLLIIADVYSIKNDFKRALTYALEAEPLVKALNNKTTLYEMYNSFAIIYNGLNLHQKRAESLEKVIAYRDSVLSNENKNLSVRLNVEMDVYGKEKEIELLNKTSELNEAELSKQKSARKFITGIAALFGVIVLVIVFFYFKIRKSNVIINKQKERVEAQNEIILSQKNLVEEKQKETIDSINYAKRIQSAVLSSEDTWNKVSKDHFVLFKPKDIVSGDFYWAYNTPNNRSVFALADCTGHGVPGGFMSMLGNSFLNEIVIENKIFNAATILNKLREKIISALEQKGEEQRKDGMDIALCVWNKLNNTLEFAGANNGLVVIRNGAITEIKPDKMPIGTYIGDDKLFTGHTMQLQAGDCLYMTTDGFPDQFGGPKGKKYKYRQLEDLLVSFGDKTMKEQSDVLNKEFETWKGKHEQIDDVCVIGIRV